MANPLTIGDLTFRSHTAARAFFKEMLARYRDKDVINANDSLQLQALLDRHCDREQKIGCGVKLFFRGSTTMGTSCFWLERVDGSTTDFSYISCIRGGAKPIEQEFAEACREAVASDLSDAKRAHIESHGDDQDRVRCEVSGELLRPDEAHLDHAAPLTFEVLVTTFLGSNRIEPNPALLSPKQDHQFRTTFADAEIAERFRQYHHTTAQLRLIKTRLNLSLGGSQRIRKLRMPVRIEQANED